MARGPARSAQPAADLVANGHQSSVPTRVFWSTLWTVGRGNPHGLRIAISLATFYLHLGEFSLYLRERVQRAIQTEERLAEQAALAATPP